MKIAKYFRNPNIIDALIIILLTLLSFILRIYLLDTLPTGFHGDEAQTGLEARRILTNGFIGVWSPSALGQSALPFYWTSVIYRLIGDTIFSTRFSFAILNVFWTPFFYLTVRLLFSRTTAIIATVFLITNVTSLAFSRRADFIAANFFIFPAIYFFVKSLYSNKTGHFVLAGTFIGLTHHIYAGYWYSFIGFFTYILFEIFFKGKLFIKKYVKNLFLLFIFYFIVAFPIFIFAYNHQDSFFSRSRMVSIFSQPKTLESKPTYQIFADNVKNTILMFHAVPDPDIWNSFAHKPVFDIFTGTFFLIGLLVSLRRLKKWEYLFITILFIFFLFPTLFTIDSPSFRRSQGSIYIAFIFVGIGITYVMQLFNKKNQSFRIISAIAIIIVTGLALYNIKEYFFHRASAQATQHIFAERLVEGTIYLNKIPDPKYVYFFSACCTIRHETIQYLLPNLKGEDRSSEFGTYSLSRSQKEREVFIFFDNYRSRVSDVEKLYPGGKKTIQKDSFGNILFTAYYLTN